MTQTADEDRLRHIVQVIEGHPDCRPSLIARLLGLHRSAVSRALPALEDTGNLLVEDEKGRLRVVGRRR